jgi:hypothetical protein
MFQLDMHGLPRCAVEFRVGGKEGSAGAQGCAADFSVGGRAGGEC